MIGQRLALVPLVLLSLFAVPLHATADEVRIIRGTLFQPVDVTGELSVEGTSGVRIHAALNSQHAGIAWDTFVPYIACLDRMPSVQR